MGGLARTAGSPELTLPRSTWLSGVRAAQLLLWVGRQAASHPVWRNLWQCDGAQCLNWPCGSWGGWWHCWLGCSTAGTETPQAGGSCDTAQGICCWWGVFQGADLSGKALSCPQCHKVLLWCGEKLLTGETPVPGPSPNTKSRAYLEADVAFLLPAQWRDPPGSWHLGQSGWRVIREHIWGALL